jgi:tripartite-type tricarboxylate transporter receptor subunit TctC
MHPFTRRLAVAASLAALSRPAFAFPDRPLRIVVPFGAGGFSDVLARFLSEPLSRRLGQPVVVENRPGAGGNIAGEAVLRAPADGHTMLLAGQAITSINPALYARMPFDPLTDFVALGFIAEVPNLAIGGPATPGGSLPGLIAAAKAAPGRLSYGSVGVGSVTHLAAAMLCAAAGIAMEHVPYRAAGAVQSDLAAGRIHLSFESAGSALGLVRGGGATALGVAGPARLRELPDVPAIAELLPGFEAIGWFGLFAAAATPANDLAALRRAISDVLASPDYTAFLLARAAQPMTLAAAQATAFLEADRRRWSEAVRLSGARAD